MCCEHMRVCSHATTPPMTGRIITGRSTESQTPRGRWQARTYDARNCSSISTSMDCSTRSPPSSTRPLCPAKPARPPLTGRARRASAGRSGTARSRTRWRWTCWTQAAASGYTQKRFMRARRARALRQVHLTLTRRRVRGWRRRMPPGLLAGGCGRCRPRWFDANTVRRTSWCSRSVPDVARRWRHPRA